MTSCMNLPNRCAAAVAALLLGLGALWAGSATAQPAGNAHVGAATLPAAADGKAVDIPIVDWLVRIHEASRKRAYIGTFVVSSGASLSSARIWHICDGEQQLVRVESLSGAPRSTFRRNDQVITFSPQTKTAVAERRESLGLFPELLLSADSSIAQHYSARRAGSERVAGVDTDVVQLLPKDDLRFGYRVWSERRTGLVVKLQTLDNDGQALEQAAFSELQLDAPVSMVKLTQMMENTDGYRVERPEIVKTTAAAEGWVLRHGVNGFKSVSCFKRPASAADAHGHAGTLQWVFSDGLASLSVFLEPLDKRRHTQEGATNSGATNTLSRRFSDKSGEWWMTLVGEVPRQTLLIFAQGLERRK